MASLFTEIFTVFYEENNDFSYFSPKMAYISETIINRTFIFLFFRYFQVLKNEKNQFCSSKINQDMIF